MSMYILAVETSGVWCGAAIVRDGKIVSETSEPSRASHNEILAPMIGSLMEKAGITFSNLSALAVSAGPGSFTALRVGLLTAKGISVPYHIPIIPVMTLDVLNASLPVLDSSETRLPVIDAYKNQVFTVLYRGKSRADEPVVCDPSSISALTVEQTTTPVKVFGPAVDKYLDVIKESLGARLSLPEDASLQPSPRALGLLAWERRNQAANPSEVQPFYLREPDARRPKKNG